MWVWLLATWKHCCLCTGQGRGRDSVHLDHRPDTNWHCTPALTRPSPPPPTVLFPAAASSDQRYPLLQCSGTTEHNQQNTLQAYHCGPTSEFSQNMFRPTLIKHTILQQNFKYSEKLVASVASDHLTKNKSLNPGLLWVCDSSIPWVMLKTWWSMRLGHNTGDNNNSYHQHAPLGPNIKYSLLQYEEDDWCNCNKQLITAQNSPEFFNDCFNKSCKLLLCLNAYWTSVISDCWMR